MLLLPLNRNISQVPGPIKLTWVGRQPFSITIDRNRANNLFYNYITDMSTDNALKQSADEYLRKHRIIELMEDLCSDLCYEQPQNINEFLIERLKTKQKQGFKTGIFTKEEITNIFTLFDLKREGQIDKERCKQALRTLANNQFQWEQVEAAGIPDKVDEKTFVGLCEKVLGVK